MMCIKKLEKNAFYPQLQQFRNNVSSAVPKKLQESYKSYLTQLIDEKKISRKKTEDIYEKEVKRINKQEEQRQFISLINDNDLNSIKNILEKIGKDKSKQILNENVLETQSSKNRVLPLEKAINKGNLSIIKYLIQQGANPNLKNENGNTLLALAIRIGNIDVVKLLLESGADPNIADREQMPPLYHALNNYNCQRNCYGSPSTRSLIKVKDEKVFEVTETVNLLLTHGAKVTNDKYKGKVEGYIFQPLFLAIKKGLVNVVELLIKYGANVDESFIGAPDYIVDVLSKELERLEREKKQKK